MPHPAPPAKSCSERSAAGRSIALSAARARFDIIAAMQTELTEQAKKLSIPDRILLVEEIWDTIAEENQAFELTDGQKRELDRRLESAKANPAQGRTGDEIKAEFMKSR
jgi:putative addiction module component (TIGR02574 family)